MGLDALEPRRLAQGVTGHRGGTTALVVIDAQREYVASLGKVVAYLVEIKTTDDVMR